MIKENIINERYPHLVVITRLVTSDNPFEQDKSLDVIYKGVGRGFTDTTTTGDSKMDTNRRKASIPVRYDEWWTELCPGDRIAVKRGQFIEKGVIRDFEPDNNRTLIYWEYNRE